VSYNQKLGDSDQFPMNAPNNGTKHTKSPIVTIVVTVIAAFVASQAVISKIGGQTIWLRVITAGLVGGFTAWLAYWLIERFRRKQD